MFNKNFKSILIIIFITTATVFAWRYIEIGKDSAHKKTPPTESLSVPILRKEPITTKMKDSSAEENKEDTIQQSPNQEYESHLPIIVKITEDKKKWKTFRDEKGMIQFRYPPELSLNKSRQDIIIGLCTISPEDAKNIPDAQIMNQLIAYVEEKSIDKIIEDQKSNNPRYFTQEAVKINNNKAVKTSYRGAFAGELWINILIKNKSNTFVLSYPGDCKENRDRFEKVIATFKLLN